MRNADGTPVKRTARWRWAEPEWRVVVHKEGEPAARVERPLPKEEPPNTTASGAARMLRAAGKMREGSTGGSPERPKDKDKENDEGEYHVGGEDEDEEEEVFTDPDGWVYADNKWEGASAKGGMGKVCFSYIHCTLFDETVIAVHALQAMDAHRHPDRDCRSRKARGDGDPKRRRR